MPSSTHNFGHPYQPYEIQLQFMSHLYDCLEAGKVGIFESPTGTGKSLSLICGSLTWLRDHKRQALDETVEAAFSSDGPDWLIQAEKDQLREKLMEERLQLEQTLRVVSHKESAENSRPPSERPGAKRIREKGAFLSRNTTDEVQHYMLEDYASDGEVRKNGISDKALSERTQTLMDMLAGNRPTTLEEDALCDETKIIICSRTHSQLTQVVDELRKVTPASSMFRGSSIDSTLPRTTERVKQLSLGSRRNLCINPAVSRLPSTNAINERCLELQKPNVAKTHKCAYLPSRQNQELVPIFRNHALSRIRDIEDLGRLGRELEICPYYASRSAIAPSEVLTLPYPLLLQESAREAMGLSLQNNIIVIDEAHNLMDAISETVSVNLSLEQLEIAMSQIMAYVQKFKSRLKGLNRVYVTQVIRLINSITDCLRQFEASKSNEAAIAAAQLLSGKGVDQIRPHKLVQYLQESKLAHKVEGYNSSQQATGQPPQHKDILVQLQSFVTVLMNPSTEGRFFAVRHERDVSVRYTLLDPREHFRKLVESARAVILAGGTMSPMSDYADYLFSYLDPKRLQMHSFGHVIPASNLYTRAIVKGPSGVDFDFTYEKRSSKPMVLELGRMLISTCRVVPDGVVVFFPSYDYLSQVLTVWRTSVAGDSVYETLCRIKPVFEESKSAPVNDLLHSYSESVDTGRGGLMLSVVGGKLSEGINFSDKLGRAVVAVGLPFPNINGAEWTAKIQYVEQVRYDQLKAQSIASEAELNKAARVAGRNFYENACMRAVNQCIGRAIRHQNDYAAIMLVDRRYATDRIHGKLPAWIRETMEPIARDVAWKTVQSGLEHFFANK